MDIVKILQKCDTWSDVKDDGGKRGRFRVSVYFDELEDANAFKVEMMMITIGNPPYDEAP